MLLGISLMILIVLTFFSLIIGNNLISGLVNIAIDNDALVDGISNTFEVLGQDVLFQINTDTLIVAGIALLVTISVVAGITGITVLGSGLNPQSARIIIFLVSFIGIWTILSILAFRLIAEIEVFGSIIYISLTLVYVVGVVQKLTGGDAQ